MGVTLGQPELKAPAMHKMDYGTELFIDDVCIQEMRGVKRVLHPATKLTQPVLSSDKPWEQARENQCSRVYLYGTVMFDEEMGKYRMWYMGRMGPQHGHTIPGLYVPRPTVPQMVTVPCSWEAAKIGSAGLLLRMMLGT